MTPIHTCWFSVAKVTDDRDISIRMHAESTIGTCFLTGPAARAFLFFHFDDSEGQRLLQGALWTRLHAFGVVTELTYDWRVESDQLLLDDPNRRFLRIENSFSLERANDLARPAPCTFPKIDHYPFHLPSLRESYSA